VSATDECSFCGKCRAEVRAMVSGVAGKFCDVCVERARTGKLYVAFCASCTPQNGQHAPTCTDSCEAS
jgi:hypothetical protein